MRRLAKPVGVTRLVTLVLATLLGMSAGASAQSADATPADASKDKASQPKVADFRSIAAALADMAAEKGKIAELKHDDVKPSTAPTRKLHLKGLGVKYQMNARTAIESGIRLGMEPGQSDADQSVAGPNPGSRGAFIKLQRQFRVR